MSQTNTYPLISEIDLLDLVNQDPDIALAIVSGEGLIVDYNPNAPRVFGADPTLDYHGKQLPDIFEIEFAEERLDWIRQVVQENETLHVEHLYQGHQMVSTLMPMKGSDGETYASIFVKRGCHVTQDGQADHVSTRYVDLGPLAKLTNRELEVFILLGHGLSVPETAKRLFRSPRTIEQHKASIGRKLGVSTIADIARIVALHGLKVEDLKLQRFLALRPEYKESE